MNLNPQGETASTGVVWATAHPTRRPATKRALIWALAGFLVGIAVIGAGLAGLAVSRHAVTCSNPGCIAPPIVTPLGPTQPYLSSQFGYSLDATGNCQPRPDADVTLTVAEETSQSVRWDIHIDMKDLSVADWPVKLIGELAAGRSAEVIAQGRQEATYPIATLVYVIPGAELGYQTGYGAVYDVYVGGQTQPIHARVLILAAVKGDLALTMDAEAPWANTDVGHPFPAETIAAYCISPVVNSITWPGESPP